MSTFTSCEKFREALLSKIEEKMFNRYGDIADPFWSSGRYNAAKWAVKGCSAASELLETTPPSQDETVEQYAARVEEALLALKNGFYRDPDDEDGFATGAVMDVIHMLKCLA